MTTKVNYPTQLRNGPMFSDAGPVAMTLQQLCAQAIGGTLAITKHWTALPTQTITCDLQFTGGSFQPAAGQTISITGPVTCPLDQQCYDASLYDGTHPAFTFPNGAPSVYGPNQFGFSSSASGAVNHAAFLAAYNGLPQSTGNHNTTVSGKPIRSGAMQISASLAPYVIGSPILISGGVALQGVAGANGGSPITTLQLANGVAISGSEVFAVAIDPTDDGGSSPNETFGSVIENICIDCNGGVSAGNNASASGLLYYGAQGSRLSVQVINAGIRGVVIGANGANQSGFLNDGQIYVAGVTKGPGVELNCSLSFFPSITVNQANENGTYLDGGGDPNPAILIQGNSNKFATVGIENSWQAMTVNASLNNWIGPLTMTPAGAGRPTGILIKGSSDLTTIAGWFTFGSNFYTNAIVDRTYSYSAPGNGAFVPGSYAQSNYNSVFAGGINLVGPQSDNARGGVSFSKQYTSTVPALVTSTWSIISSLASGSSPAFHILQVNPPQASSVPPLFNFGPLGTATGLSGNYNSVATQWIGTYWNGAAAAQATVTAQFTLSAGTTPFGTLAFTGSGNFLVAVPAVRMTAQFTFATLPTPALGMMAVITDSSTNTWGANITGGGGNVVIGWWNGVNWTVVAK